MLLSDVLIIDATDRLARPSGPGRPELGADRAKPAPPRRHHSGADRAAVNVHNPTREARLQQAAIGALVALSHRDATGRGDLVDVSAQASVVTALSHAPAFVDLLGLEPTRAGAFMTGRSIKGARYRVFWPCRDGYINFIFYGGVAGRRTNEQLVAWMRECGADLGALAAIDWKVWDPTKADQSEVDGIEAPPAKFFPRLRQ